MLGTSLLGDWVYTVGQNDPNRRIAVSSQLWGPNVLRDSDAARIYTCRCGCGPHGSKVFLELELMVVRCHSAYYFRLRYTLIEL